MRTLAATIRLLAVLGTAYVATLAAHAQAPAGAPAPPEAQRRVALVVGNASYETAPLRNPANDARDMAQALRDAGFTVLLHTDIDQRQMLGALREFGEKLKAGGAGLFYFAGHGVQIKGRNYLIPVRSRIEHEDEVAYAALDVQALLDKMESAGNGTNIVILDACRNNPFTRSLRSSQQGLAQMDAPVGTLVAYATAPGSVAVDSHQGLRNGLYTTHLLEAVRQPGLKIEEVFKQVRNAVLRSSSNRQQPWESTALVGDFYFHPPAAQPPGASSAGAPPTPALEARAAADDALWDAVRDGRDGAELFTYLRRFPEGRHAGQARQRLARLSLAQSADAGTLSTPPGDAESLERLSRGSAQVQRELAATVALARGPGEEGLVSTTVSERGADGSLTRIHFDGTWRTAVDEVDLPPHFETPRVAALMVEVSLLGTVAGAAPQRLVRWIHRYWFVRELRLPLRISVDERLDDSVVRRARHELVAVDLLAP